MKRYLLFVFLLNVSSSLFGQWTNLNSNIPGDLFCVSFSTTSTGLVGGSAGLFNTTNGGANWQRVNPTGSAADTLVYHSSTFKSLLYVSSSSVWIAAGRDTIQNKAVLFRVNSAFTACDLVYSGAIGTGLSDVKQVLTYQVAVGKGGLGIVSANGGLTWTSLANFSSSQDLYSVANNGSSVLIIGNGISYQTTNFPNSGWTSNTGTPYMNKIAYGSSFCGAGTGAYYSTNLGASWSTIIAYNSYPINGRSIVFRSSNDGSIATDHGVYQSVNGIYYWEFQPTSAGYNLNDIFFFSAGTGYAVGNNGLVIKTTNSGGPTLPYVNYTSAHGACVDSTIQFTNVSPSISGYSYKWKNNAVQFSSAYNSSYTFNATGNYNLTLVGTHNSLSDSLTRIMPIVNLPDLNKTYSVSDTLLCKNGSSIITVHLSDAGTIYKLYRLNPFLQVDQAVGNGGDIDLHTGIITDSTYYRVKAFSSLADCGGYLPDTILVGVEKTKAAFHSHLINAELNEGVNYFENCTQATIFDWRFGASATPSVSSNANPVGITYAALGQTQVTLIASSANGCVDTVNGNGVYIYDSSDPALNADCWAINFDGINPGYTQEHEAGYDLCSDAQGNLLVGGRFTQAIIASRAGINYGRTPNSGLFLASYNSKGVLKWLVHGDEAADINRITEVERSKDGFIYATGFGNSAWIHSNQGDSVYLGDGSYIFKFDSIGGLVWYCTFPSLQQIVMPLKLDSAGNCYVAGVVTPTSFFSSIYGTQTISLGIMNSFIARINADGSLGWITKLTSSSNYYTGIQDIATDNAGHFFITGSYSQPLTFNSVSSGSITTPSAGTGCDIFIAKYTTAGNVVWVQHAGTPPGNTSDYGFSLEADDAGNTYLGGQVACNYIGMWVEFPGPNNSVINKDVGQLFYASFDTSGVLRWAEGTGYSRSGRSSAMAIGKNHDLLSCADLFSASASNATFISSDNASTVLPINNSSLYFLSYDTAGVIHFVNTETGITPTAQAVEATGWGIDDDNAGNVYISGEIYVANGNPYYTIADTILTINRKDAFIAKFGAGCIVPNNFLITQIQAEQTELQNQVFPNPSSGNFRLVFPGAGSRQIRILNLTGETIYESNMTDSSIEIDLSKNATGVYFCQFTRDGILVETKKLVIQ